MTCSTCGPAGVASHVSENGTRAATAADGCAGHAHSIGEQRDMIDTNCVAGSAGDGHILADRDHRAVDGRLDDDRRLIAGTRAGRWACASARND